MALFSQRKGIRPLEKAIQRESMDVELRNGLWNAIKISVFDKRILRDSYDVIEYQSKMSVEALIGRIWFLYFKKTLDTLPEYENTYKFIRDYYFSANWWEVYDLIEFIMKSIPEVWQVTLRNNVTHYLSEENAPYRIINNEIVEITDENEISAVETAIEKSNRIIKSHLATALELLSERNKPDYRNSIKESISAVESVCQLLAGKPKATLGDCIGTIKKTSTLHPAFKQALLKLYGYTSDEGGIRHALTEGNVSPSFADAKFMLVTCSAFVNFLWTRASEQGIRIEN